MCRRGKLWNACYLVAPAFGNQENAKATCNFHLRLQASDPAWKRKISLDRNQQEDRETAQEEHSATSRFFNCQSIAKSFEIQQETNQFPNSPQEHRALARPRNLNQNLSINLQMTHVEPHLTLLTCPVLLSRWPEVWVVSHESLTEAIRSFVRLRASRANAVTSKSQGFRPQELTSMTWPMLCVDTSLRKLFRAPMCSNGVVLV